MHDIFLSYSRADRQKALAVRAELTSVGLTVWTDVVSPAGAEKVDADALDPHTVGIPVGQDHRQTILRAIRDAGVFLAADSPSWRTAEYCRRELLWAREMGKPIAVTALSELPAPTELDGAFIVKETDFASLAKHVRESRTIARAHSRLLARLQDPIAGTTLAERLSPIRRAGMDAELLLTMSAGVLSPTMSPELNNYTIDLLRRENWHRRRLQTFAATLAAILAVLLITAGVFAVAASSDQARAQRSADRALSINLAGQALLSDDVVSAAANASQSLALDSNPESRSAAAVTSVLLGTHRDYQLPPHPYMSGAVSSDGQRVAFAYPQGLVLLSANGHVISDVTLSSFIGGQPVVFGPANLVYVVPVVGQDARKLLAINPSTGRASRVGTINVNAVTSDMRGKVWWAAVDGSVGTVTDKGGTGPALIQTGARISALEARPDVLTMVTDDDRVIRYRLPLQQGVAPVWIIDLRATESPGPVDIGPEAENTTWASRTWTFQRRLSAQNNATILTCGARTHVTLAGGAAGRVDEGLDVELGQDGRVLDSYYAYDRVLGLACGPGDSAFGVNMIGNGVVRPFPASAWAPVQMLTSDDFFAVNVLASTPDGTSPVLIQHSGRVEFLGTSIPTRRTLGSAMAAFPLGSKQCLLQMLNGDLYLASSDRPSGRVGNFSEPLVRTPIVVGPDLAIGYSANTIVRLSDRGVTASWPFPEGVTSVNLAGDAHTLVVVTGEGAVKSIDIDSGIRRTLWSPKPGRNEDAPERAALNGTTLLLASKLGNLIRINLATGDQAAVGDVAPTINMLLASPRASGVLVVAGSDGVIRSYNQAMHLLAARQLGGPVIQLQASPTGQVLAHSGDSLFVLDVDSLELRLSLPLRRTANAFLGPDGRTPMAFSPFIRGNSDETAMYALRIRAMSVGVPQAGSQLEDELASITQFPVGL
jgi:hypothetical protein